MPVSYIWVATIDSFQPMVTDLERQSQLAVDTESNSLHAYREQVCLIQISTQKKDYLVDPLTLSDLSALAPIFLNPRIEKVFHAAEYDLACLQRDFGFKVQNIFDTMQAARILGYTRVGLDALLSEKFQITVDKRYQKSDWARRPLSKEQLTYACNDTHHLIALRQLLQAELVASQRWELAQEEFLRTSRVIANSRNGTPPWLRIAFTQGFTGQQLAILHELSEWRESTAIRLDRPPFKVLDDSRLVGIAQSNARSHQDLHAFLTPRQVACYGKEILDALSHGRKAHPLARPPRSPRPPSSYLRRLDRLNRWRRETAQKLKLESDLILPRNWMQAIAEKDPQDIKELSLLMPDSTYRLQTYGNEILAAIATRLRKQE